MADLAIKSCEGGGGHDADNAYLLSLQEEESVRVRLEQLIASGKSPQEIALLCDETGQLKYCDESDPDALDNRLLFFDPLEVERMPVPRGIPGSKKDGFFRQHDAFYDYEYYHPSVDAIRRTRDLIAMQVRNAATLGALPNLRTHEDFMHYFGQFHPDVLRELFANLTELQLTVGCDGPCRSVCALPVVSKVQWSMPFETVEWIMRNYGFLWNASEDMTLYGGSDLLDYRDGDKTAIDVSKLFNEVTGRYPGVSFSYRLDRKSIDIYYRMMRENIPISRISRLNSGVDPKFLDKLVRRIRARAGEDGYELSNHDLSMLQSAFLCGGKLEFNTMIGNAIGVDTPEREMANWQCRCSHGVTFSPDRGFEGIILRPATRQLPYSSTSYPIVPNPEDGKIRIPFNSYIGVAEPHYLRGQGQYVRGPRFLTLSPSGEELRRESISAEEKRILDLTELKLCVYDYELGLHVMNKEKKLLPTFIFIADYLKTLLERGEALKDGGLSFLVDRLANFRLIAEDVLNRIEVTAVNYSDNVSVNYELYQVSAVWLNAMDQNLPFLEAILLLFSKFEGRDLTEIEVMIKSAQASLLGFREALVAKIAALRADERLIALEKTLCGDRKWTTGGVREAISARLRGIMDFLNNFNEKSRP